MQYSICTVYANMEKDHCAISDHFWYVSLTSNKVKVYSLPSPQVLKLFTLDVSPQRLPVRQVGPFIRVNKCAVAFLEYEEYPVYGYTEVLVGFAAILPSQTLNKEAQIYTV